MRHLFISIAMGLTCIGLWAQPVGIVPDSSILASPFSPADEAAFKQPAKGLEKGRAEGKAEGKAEGMAEGMAEERRLIMEKLKMKGFSEEEIASILA